MTRLATLVADTGFFTIPMAKQVQEVFAVDIEPKMLRMLRKMRRKCNLKTFTMLKVIWAISGWIVVHH
ncbi:MAG: hypothetical protein IKF66_07670 [Methanobrevibacter sp.]|nr:hypothetical protein [Methanobrevibacter sp.]